MKQNLPTIFYAFGIMSIIHLTQQSISSDMNGQFTEGIIVSVLLYPFSFLPFSEFFYFIISVITNLSIFWLVLGYFIQEKNKITGNNKPSVGYKISKWLLILLCSLFFLMTLWGVINFFKNI